MIKFWKSAAKGKSGCPVRPPERSSVVTSKNKTLLDTKQQDNQDFSQIFEKKSKLTITLHDILIDKKTIKYFIQYMETCKNDIIKCWMELEHFKILVTKANENIEHKDHLRLTQARSVDFSCKGSSLKQQKDKVSQRYSWRDNIDTSNSSNSKLNNQVCSTSSCDNLAEYVPSLQNHDISDNEKPINLTEVAINVFKKYIAQEAPHQLDLPDTLRKLIISNICQPEGHIKVDCFQPVQDELFNQMEKKYFNDFQNSPLYIKAQIDILTSGSLNLKDILYNETILFYFTEYLEQESCCNLLEFLMAAMHFRENLINGNTTNSEQAQSDAIVLYEKYFSLQATTPIGFPTDIRLKIECDICRESGPVAECFDLPYQIVFKTLTQYIKSFLESELYYKYLSEMIHSVEQRWSTNHKSHSDCSSEFSISTQNTLLAMGDPIYRRRKRNHSVPDMTIDSNQLYNADALWQRKKYDGLSLGRVNSLGRFESKFEPDPDKKSKSVLKKMVSKFVPTNTSKVEEEMAWQIAHMIVKDVTDLTMAPPDSENDDV